ncbi:MAG: hypothetical protein AAF581_10440 [Planctomycetota bacterium]
MSLAEQVTTWQRFLLQLTVFGGRCYSSDAPTMAQINEINHRVLNRVLDIQNAEKWTSTEGTFDMIRHHVGLAPALESAVEHALRRALD